MAVGLLNHPVRLFTCRGWTVSGRLSVIVDFEKISGIYGREFSNLNL